MCYSIGKRALQPELAFGYLSRARCSNGQHKAFGSFSFCQRKEKDTECFCYVLSVNVVVTRAGRVPFWNSLDRRI